MKLPDKYFASVIVFIVLFISGCAKPYDPPTIDGYQSAFPGIKQYAQMGNTRVVWIHGMCKHDDRWANNRHALLSHLINTSHTDKVRQSARGPYHLSFSDSAFGNKIETRFLIWSPAFVDAKARLSLDNPINEARAQINRQVKAGLMNDCLADAVAYIGTPGKIVRHWLKEEICRSFDGKLTASGGCNVIRSADTNVVFVSESLGSKMMSDALQSIWQSTQGVERRQKLAVALSNVQSVFVVSNQIPILNVAEHSPAQKAKDVGIREYPGLQVLVDARETITPHVSRSFAPLHYVSFSDPNDLLSYKLLNYDVNRGVKLTNITVSNAPTYFGLLENPLNAHCGYQWNPYVLATIIEGFNSGGVRKLSTKISKVVCL